MIRANDRTRSLLVVDSAARAGLAVQLRGLIDGKVTNDAFDDQLYEWEHCPDIAVPEIAKFAETLYSSVTVVPQRLVGESALRGEELAAAERCVCFLATEREYRWPDSRDDPSNACECFGVFSFFGLGLAVLIGVAILPEFLIRIGQPVRDYEWELLTVTVALAVNWWNFRRRHRWMHIAWLAANTPSEFQRSAWPFARQEDVETS